MRELIDKQALLEDIETTVLLSGKPVQILKEMCAAHEVISRIKAAPAVDVVEMKHGKWIQGLDGSCMCSECSKVIRYEIDRHCPGCGAKMDLKDET